ncbi:MAG: permease [Dactylosporangium sp.]|nr:permease [Dactylosporangium sp.]NNJ62815.1 permease [Dactylosporangium sp.]
MADRTGLTVVTRTTTTPAEAAPGTAVEPTRRVRPVEVLIALLAVAVVGRIWLADTTFALPVQAWLTVFVAIVVQATPFIVLGTLVSGAITALVPPSFFTRVLPARHALAVPVAGVAGVVLPGCECGSVPVAGALVRRGVAPAAALAFLLSAPAINPVVLVATSVAFPGQPLMVLARFGASLVTAVLMGWLWLRFGRPEWFRPTLRRHPEGAGTVSVFLATCREDMTQAGGYLVLGALAAATLNVVVPPGWLQAVADHPVWSVLALALLAVVLSLCSEADAFVAASLPQFSLTARLAFLVVGPMVDIKLVAMQIGTFGRGMALRFAPATFGVAVGVSVVVGALLW